MKLILCCYSLFARLMKTKNIEIIPTVHAGFPSPAENYLENTMDLNKALIKGLEIPVSTPKMHLSLSMPP